MNQPRIAFLDIESSHLKANFARILCVSWKWQGQRQVHTAKLETLSPASEARLLKRVYLSVKDADVIVFHYGSRFDWPMLQTKMIKYNIGPLPPIPFIDTWRVSKYKLNLHSNRLDTLARYFNVKHQKTPLDPDTWLSVMEGDKKALEYIVEHCEADVRVLEEVYNKVRPLITNHPSFAAILETPKVCPNCGADKLTARGTLVTTHNKYQRYNCQSCGTWTKGPIIKPHDKERTRKTYRKSH